VVILRVEHAVRDYEAWKRAFDGDPVGREAGGVRGYRVLRPTDDPMYVVIDLEFDSAAEADAFADRLRALWDRAGAELGLERNALRSFEVADTSAEEVHG
jgi:hypothetical protein